MADKRISQLIERTDIANNDVLPIVASGATTTNKVTISTIQDWMQDNLDVGVTSVGITLGTTGTDVNVSGSPITTSGNITINIPDASTSARGVVTTGSQTFAGNKSFQNTIFVNAGLRLDQNGTALPTFVQNISGTGLISSGSNGLGFNSANNLYFSGSEKGGAVLAVNNSAVRTYTLQDANGTLAFTSDLSGYVTLGTAQTITAQKTFTTSGSSDTMIISHGSGSGIALDVIKAGNGEAIRVQKTSGSGNAVTITGGTLSAEAGQFSGDLQTSTRISATSGSNAITITPNVGGTQNRIETTGTLPLSLVSAAAITMAAGGTTPQITLATTGAVTLTGALNGTSASFTSSGIAVPLEVKSNTSNFGRIRVSSTTSTAGNYRGYEFSNGSTFRGGLVQDESTEAISIFTPIGGQSFILASTGAATFSSDVNAGTGFQGRYTRIFEASAQRGGLYPYNVISGAGTDYSIGLFSESSLWFAAGGGITKHLTIASNGAATFSSSVTATSFVVGNGQFYRATRTSGSLITDMIGIPSGTNDVRVLTTGAFSVVSGGLSSFLHITDAGNVGIGTASPGGLIHSLKSGTPIAGVGDEVFIGQNTSGASNSAVTIVSNNEAIIRMTNTTNVELGKILYNTTSNFMRFDTNTTERMRITSGGALKASTTGSYLSATGTGHELRANKGDGAALVVNNINTSSPYGLAIVYGSTRNNNVDFFIECVDSTATRFIVSSNGNVTNTNGSYGAISDIKLKENIEDATPKLDDLLKVKVRNYNLIGEETKQIGVIAQELEEVFPAMVSESEDFEEVEVPQLDEEGNEVLNEEGEVVTTKERVSKGTTTKSVKYSVFVPMLIKAIQEQQEIINEMRAEIDLLKTK